MYLARVKKNNRISYQIRQSVRDPHRRVLISRTLMQLGEDPGAYIVYPGGNAFYIREDVEEALERQQVSYAYDELEELFWPFVDPEIRFKLGPFMDRGRKTTGRKASTAQLAAVHLFDKRRLYYLRCAHMDQSDLRYIDEKLYTPLVNKSRDELEQYFMAMEMTLDGRELKGYVFTIFDLQQFFPPSRFWRSMPEAIAEEKLDDAFMEAYCRLDADAGFWAGFERGVGINDYLSRYLVMFFDHQFPARAMEEEFIRNFINSRRRYSPPVKPSPVAPEEVLELFGKTVKELKAMKRTALTRLFRKRAKELHPDKGGSNEAFIRLTAVYSELRKQAGK
jgi:hypothetical protein